MVYGHHLEVGILTMPNVRNDSLTITVPTFLWSHVSFSVFIDPGSPKEFLIDVLEKLQKSRTTKMDYPCLFDESNINSIFGMLDPVGKGYITLQQYKEGETL